VEFRTRSKSCVLNDLIVKLESLPPNTPIDRTSSGWCSACAAKPTPGGTSRPIRLRTKR